MPLVFQSSSTSSNVAVANGNELIVRDYVDIYVVGTAVTLSGGSTETGILNHGNIYGYLGLNVNSDSSRIVNYGTISGIRTGSETGDAIDIGGTGGTHAIANFGTITAEGYLIRTSEVSGPFDVSFSNHGTAFSESGLLRFSTQLNNAYVNNSGLLQGGSLRMDGSGSARLLNSGEMRASSIYLNADFGARLYDEGSISGEETYTFIYGGLFNDVVTNRGTIHGLVFLSGGDDVYNGLDTGVVTFPVDGGPGNDTMLGGNAADQFEGDGDADLLIGRDGDDTLDGGAGNDMMLGGDGPFAVVAVLQMIPIFHDTRNDPIHAIIDDVDFGLARPRVDEFKAVAVHSETPSMRHLGDVLSLKAA